MTAERFLFLPSDDIQNIGSGGAPDASLEGDYLDTEPSLEELLEAWVEESERAGKLVVKLRDSRSPIHELFIHRFPIMGLRGVNYLIADREGYYKLHFENNLPQRLLVGKAYWKGIKSGGEEISEHNWSTHAIKELTYFNDVLTVLLHGRISSRVQILCGVDGRGNAVPDISLLSNFPGIEPYKLGQARKIESPPEIRFMKEVLARDLRRIQTFTPKPDTVMSIALEFSDFRKLKGEE